MPPTLRDYIIQARYLIAGEGWKMDVTHIVDTTMELAWHRASAIARDLDSRFGDDHFWTVDLKNPEGSSYVQLFHGRLS